MRWSRWLVACPRTPLHVALRVAASRVALLDFSLRDAYAYEHGRINSLLRDVKETLMFECEQINGEFWDPIRASFAVLESPSHLNYMGFVVDFEGYRQNVPSEHHPLVVYNREHAIFSGFYALRRDGLRTKRRLNYIRGWPGLGAAMAKRSKTAEIMNILRADYGRFLSLAPYQRGVEVGFRMFECHSFCIHGHVSCFQ